MNGELRQFITANRFYQGSIEAVARRLPADDAELEAWLAETVAQSDQKNFMFLIAAAFHRERRVSSRHLSGGAMLFPSVWWLGQAVRRMQGEDVPEQLLAALKSTRLSRDIAAAGFLSGAVWCEEHRGGTLPAEWITEARLLARQEPRHLAAESFLIALALRRNDAGLLEVLQKRLQEKETASVKWEDARELAEKFGAELLERSRAPALTLVADKPSNQLAHGRTMRRAVARIGRNDPCPCQSGKKYKHCCHDQDQERLRHSSAVAGVTQEELSAAPETGLTLARLKTVQPHELIRFDVTKIPAELRETYFIHMAGFNFLGEAVAALEKIGYTPELFKAWDQMVFCATTEQRRDVLERLVRVRQAAEPEFRKESLELSNLLLLAEDDAAECLNLLNGAAYDVLVSEDVEELLGFAYAVTISRHRALGILIYRSTFPIVPPDRAAVGFEQVLQARDRLQLSPDDPFSDFIDERLRQPGGAGKEAAALEAAQAQLDRKAREVRDLKESVAQMQREILQREKAAATVQAPAAPGNPRAADIGREMRAKVEGLKTLLKGRHQERNELRRELQRVQAELEQARQQAGAARNPEPAKPEVEADWLNTNGELDNQPVRLIGFPKGFAQTLKAVPRPVARGAMSMIGRLAAGEAAAYVGALKLKATPNVMRQRIGSDYRLMFRLGPEQVEVLDLINRKDLDRWLRTSL